MQMKAVDYDRYNDLQQFKYPSGLMMICWRGEVSVENHKVFSSKKFPPTILRHAQTIRRKSFDILLQFRKATAVQNRNLMLEGGRSQRQPKKSQGVKISDERATVTCILHQPAALMNSLLTTCNLSNISALSLCVCEHAFEKKEGWKIRARTCTLARKESAAND